MTKPGKGGGGRAWAPKQRWKMGEEEEKERRNERAKQRRDERAVAEGRQIGQKGVRGVGKKARKEQVNKPYSHVYGEERMQTLKQEIQQLQQEVMEMRRRRKK